MPRSKFKAIKCVADVNELLRILLSSKLIAILCRRPADAEQAVEDSVG